MKAGLRLVNIRALHELALILNVKVLRLLVAGRRQQSEFRCLRGLIVRQNDAARILEVALLLLLLLLRLHELFMFLGQLVEHLDKVLQALSRGQIMLDELRQFLETRYLAFELCTALFVENGLDCLQHGDVELGRGNLFEGLSEEVVETAADLALARDHDLEELDPLLQVFILGPQLD